MIPLLGRPGRLLFRLAARIAPAELRDEWEREWTGELAALEQRTASWPAQRRRLARDAVRVLWRDACWLRWQNGSDPDARPSRLLLHAPIPGAAEGPWRALAADLRFGARRLRRSPAFSLVVVGLLGSAVLVVTVVGAILRSVLSPLDYAEPERLLRILALDTAEGQRDWLAQAEIDRLRTARSLDGLGVSTTFPATWKIGDESRRVQRAFVTEDYFPVLGAVAGRGRLLGQHPADRDAVVLSHHFWSAALRADPAVLGRTLELDGRTLTVVGVTSPSTHTHDFSTPPADVWILFPERSGAEDPDFRILTAVGRLRQDATVESAAQELAALHSGLGVDRPEVYRGWQLDLEPLRDSVVGPAQRQVPLVAGALVLLLVAVAANLANLVAARLLGRRRELRIHVALGGRADAVTRQLTLEGAVLAVLGTSLGLAAATAVLARLPTVVPVELPRSAEVALAGSDVLLSLAVAGAMTLVFAWLPSAVASRRGWLGTLRSTRSASHRAGRWRAWMVRMQLAVAVPLCLLAALLAGRSAELRTWQLGFDPEGLTSMRISLPFAPDLGAEDRRRRFAELAEIAAASPGVRGAGFTLQVPLVPHQADRSRVWILDRPREDEEPTRALYQVISPGYLAALGAPVLAGRPFTPSDRHDSEPVVLISEELRRRELADVDPIGRRLRLELVLDGEPEVRTIVGVVGDLAQLGPGAPTEPMVFLPHGQVSWPSMSLVVRSPQPREALAAVRAAALGRAADAVVEPAVDLAVARDRLVAPSRAAALSVAVLAGSAALLSLLGLAALLAHEVLQTRRDAAIRRALGATTARLRGEVLLRAVRQMAWGTFLGVLASAAAWRFLAAAIPAITSPGATVPLLALAGFWAAGLLAAGIPASRVGAASPASLLRGD